MKLRITVRRLLISMTGLGLLLVTFQNCTKFNAANSPSTASGSAAPPTPQPVSYIQDLATIPTRQSHHGFPRLANQLQVSYIGDASNGYLGQNLLARLHWMDYSVVDGNMAVNNTFNPQFATALGRSGTIRALNPNLVVTAYFSVADYNDDPKAVCYQPLGFTYPFGPDFQTSTCSDPSFPGPDDFDEAHWLFHDPTGAPIKLFMYKDGSFSHIPDPNILGMRSRYVSTVNNMIVSAQMVDGVFHDWGGNSLMPNLGPSPGYTVAQGVSLQNNSVNDLVNIGNSNDPVNLEWQNGMKALYALGRATYPPGFIMSGNSGWGADPVMYTDFLQGTLLESFNGCVAATSCGWQKAMYTYATYLKTGPAPAFSFIMVGIDPGTASQFAQLRFGLASSLLFDGYFCATNSGAYESMLWMDEYAVDGTGAAAVPTDATTTAARASKGWLGEPLADAYSNSNPGQTLWSVIQAGGLANTSNKSVWRRDFTNGIVLVNPTTSTVQISLNGSFRKIHGVIDTTFNNGATGLTNLTLAPQTGAILLK